MLLLRYLFIACILLCTGELRSQRYPFISYTPIDGLVNNRVRTMFQDSKGRLYFLTAGGLSQYDGARFTNYTSAEGLPVEMVNDMLEIAPDSFWIATNINKVNCLVRGKIKLLPTADGFYPLINKFLRTTDGTIYAAADDGLFIWQKNRFVPLPVFYQGRNAGEYIIELTQVGRLLIYLVNPGLSSDRGCFFLYDPENKKVLYKEDKRFTNHLTASPSGDIWVADDHGLSVLKKDKLEQGKVVHDEIPESFALARNKRSSFLRFDKLGQLWVSVTDEGVYFIKPGQVPVLYTERSGLASLRITYIFQDQEGSNWFLPEGGGAQKLVGNNIELLDRPYGSKSISDLAGSINSDSVVLYGDQISGLILVYGSTVKHFPTTFNNEYARFVVKDGAIVYLFDGNNILKYELPITGTKLKTICRYAFSGRQLSYGVIDPNRNLVFCSAQTLRVILNDCSSFFYPLHYYADQITFDRNGNLWLVTRSGKLMALSLHPENPAQYLQFKYDLSDQLKISNPRSMILDDSNRIWIGTRFDGLFCFAVNDGHLQPLHHLTKKEGLTDNFVNYLEYAFGAIWSSSPAGLDKIITVDRKLVVENITESNKVYISLRKIVVDRQGTVWASGESGNLMKVNKRKELNQVMAPKFFISHINAGQETYEARDSNHHFEHTQNNLSFFVAAPSFFNEKEIKFSYMLSGSGNHDWSKPSPDAAFHFINLAPGNYVLKLKAEFPAGRFPPQYLSYSFIVNPPWWQTWWFRGFLVLVAIGISIAVVRSYYRAKFLKQKILLEKKQAIEKERTRIATDMHDDLGAGLSRIKYLSESIQFKKSGDDSIYGEVQKIATYSDEMVEKMGEIVWALSEKNDTLDHLVAFTRSYAVDYLATNNIKCVFYAVEVVPSAFVTGELRRNVFLSVKESLHNVVKHASAKTVTIQVTIDSHLKFMIHDDGVGIDWSNIRPFSNGLSNIQKRMEEIGGKVQFQNKEGTEILLDVPLKE